MQNGPIVLEVLANGLQDSSSRLLKNGFFCHPERSEGSRIYNMNRFFAFSENAG
jgi:hypothetical protein